MASIQKRIKSAAVDVIKTRKVAEKSGKTKAVSVVNAILKKLVKVKKISKNPKADLNKLDQYLTAIEGRIVKVKKALGVKVAPGSQKDTGLKVIKMKIL